MRTLHVDGSAGAAGDMILAALVDAGAPLRAVRSALATLPLAGWSLSARTVERSGLRALQVRVTVRGEDGARTFREIRKVLAGGALPRPVRERAVAVFRRLVEAEAEVHGVPFETAHLHEAGAVDAIVDVAGCCLALHHLEVERIVVSPLTLGFGTIRCAHGTYPVPPPAVARLVRGLPVRPGNAEGERLTPTGAAILATLADAWGPMPAMRPRAEGYGAGERTFPGEPNVLRVILGDEEPAGLAEAPSPDPEVAVITVNVDDAAPQVLAYACERLLEAGALEAYTTPVLMKKGRAGHELTVLGRPEDLGLLADIVLAETTTLGLRWRIERRRELPRAHVTVRTPHGPVRIKVGTRDGRPAQAWPEYEDCAAIARRTGRPVREIQRAALRAWEGKTR